MLFAKKPDYMKELASLLANGDNRESFLGVKNPKFPTAQEIRDNAARLAAYSDSKDYLVFAEEAWARVLSHLDTILDDKTSFERVQYHRGALREALDLLRVSYQARNVVDQADKQNVTSER